MKRIISFAAALTLGSLLVMAQGGAGSGSGAGGSGGAAGTGGGGGSSSTPVRSRIHVTASPMTIEGVVTAVHLSYGLEYPSIEVNSLLIKLAPVWFLLESDFEVAVGDLVLIQAMPCHNMADAYYYALAIAKLDPVTREVLASLVLRDANGLPLWTGGGTSVQPQGSQRCSTGPQPCVVRFSALAVTGTVEHATLTGDGIRHPLLYLKTEDGKLFSIRLGPPEAIFGADFELRPGEAITVRYALTSRNRERVALDIGYTSGSRIILRNEAGGPAWIRSR